MQQSEAWESPQQGVFLLLLELCMGSDGRWAIYPSNVDTSSVVAVPKLLRSRTRARRRRRKRAWTITCTYLLRCASSLARRRLAAAVAVYEGEHDGICCQSSY